MSLFIHLFIYPFNCASLHPSIYLFSFDLLQALVECVRLRTFGKFGLQQMQVDAHYLQIYLWKYVTDEQ